MCTLRHVVMVAFSCLFAAFIYVIKAIVMYGYVKSAGWRYLMIERGKESETLMLMFEI